MFTFLLSTASAQEEQQVQQFDQTNVATGCCSVSPYVTHERCESLCNTNGYCPYTCVCDQTSCDGMLREDYQCLAKEGSQYSDFGCRVYGQQDKDNCDCEFVHLDQDAIRQQQEGADFENEEAGDASPDQDAIRQQQEGADFENEEAGDASPDEEPLPEGYQYQYEDANQADPEETSAAEDPAAIAAEIPALTVETPQTAYPEAEIIADPSAVPAETPATPEEVPAAEIQQEIAEPQQELPEELPADEHKTNNANAVAPLVVIAGMTLLL